MNHFTSFVLLSYVMSVYYIIYFETNSFLGRHY